MGETSKTMQGNVKIEHKIDVEAEMNRWKRRSIYKLPACVTTLNKEAYKPQLVSFGPYHYDDEDLKPMEEHKERALLHFLERSGKPEESYIESLNAIVKDLMDAYDALPPRWQENRDDFLKLMVRDGCFMLEILRTSIQSMRNYALNDPIFSDHGRIYIMPYIRRDMLMIENQIPISVLEKLLAVEGVESKDTMEYINWLIFKLYHSGTEMKLEGKSLHVLDVYRKSMLQGKNENLPKKDKVNDDKIVRSATELQKAGIKIKTSGTRSLKDITFDDWGILSLPAFVVDDVTKTMFLNLIAFERFHVGAGNEVTAYVFFMDSIINDSKDVKLLHSCEIIQNALGSDKAVADLFNSLSVDGSLDSENSLSMVHYGVANYCKKQWPRWRTNLARTYFRSPWAIISLIAAVILFALTATQTAYSVLGYHKG